MPDLNEIATSVSAITAIGSTSFAEWQSSQRTHVAVLDLPDEILTGIGKLVVHWALADYALAGMYYNVMQLDRREGRMTQTTPRLKDLTGKISQLAKLRNITFPTESWNNFGSTLNKCDFARNLVSHGVWFRENHKLFVQEASGERGKDQPSKKYLPGALEITPAWLKVELDRMHDALRELKQYRNQLEAGVRAWRDKSR